MVESKYGLPAGLPACIAQDKSGIKALQELFGLSNRKEWQSILHSQTVKDCLAGEKLKLRGLSTSQRVSRSVLAFYGQPDARWDGWKLYCPLGPDIPPVRDSEFVPSLEYAALMRYDPSFHGREADPELVESSLEGIIGFRYSRRLPEFEEPALAVWPAIWSDLQIWSTLPADRQDAVVLAAFAVASILNDVRLLGWASKQSARLAEEFAFALGATAQRPPEAIDSGAGDSPGTLPAPAGVLEDWNRSCDLIIGIASDLKANPPEPQRLDDLLRPVKRLEDLRPEILAAIDIKNRKALVSRVPDILKACADDLDAPWLGAVRGKVHALWQLAYCIPAAVSEDELKADLDRLQADLMRELRLWRDLEGTKAKDLTELSELQASAGPDLELQLEAEAREGTLLERMAEGTRKAKASRLRALEAIAPTGWEFEPSRDYESELADGIVPAALIAPSAASGGAPTQTCDPPSPDAPSPEQASHPDGGVDRQEQIPSTREQLGAPEGKAEISSETAAEDVRSESPGSSGPAQRRRARAEESPAGSAKASNALKVAATEPFWSGGWEDWVNRIGDPTDPDRIKPWNPADVPKCPAASPFADPIGFAESLSGKLTCGLVECPRDTLLVLVEYLNSDPQRGRREWREIYREMLNYCLREELDTSDSQAIALPLISLSLRANPSDSEYRQLVDAADRLTALPPEGPNVKWALELTVPFVVNRCADRDYLATFLDSIDQYVSTSGYHLASKHRSMWSELKKLLERAKSDAPRASHADEFLQDSERLSSFLKGKSIVIYTLQRSAALTARDRIRAIESSAEIRLLHDKVWSESLQDPIRNADLCVMVKSAATHSVTEMISRTRRNAGKVLIVPPWKGVHSILRSIYDAARTGDRSVLAPTKQQAGVTA